MKTLVITIIVFSIIWLTVNQSTSTDKPLANNWHKIGVSLHPGKIIKQITDERGLTSVMYEKDGHEWALDYLTKREYDSAFHNYINYKQ